MNTISEKTQQPRSLSRRSPILGVMNNRLGERLSKEIERVGRSARPIIVSDLGQLCDFASRFTPAVIVLDCDLLQREPLEGILHRLEVFAPVILIGPPERQNEIARLLAGNGIEFVARTGDFVPLAASVVDRRLRWAEEGQSALIPPWVELPADIETVFRHEINNPLTGILGNAELVLAHDDRLSPVDSQRLQTVVDLAVRLRETVRRLSNVFEHRHSSDISDSRANAEDRRPAPLP